MSAPFATLRAVLPSRSRDADDAGDDRGIHIKAADVTPVTLQHDKGVTEKRPQNQGCNPCNTCNPEKVSTQEQRQDEARTENLAMIAGWRAEIAAVKPDRPEIDKLKTTSLRFLDSPDALTAVENEWDAVSLFGMHEGQAPKERIDCWGLVLFLAWGVHGCTVETIDQKVCALRTRTGAVQRQPRLRANFYQAAPWWRHPGITNEIEGD